MRQLVVTMRREYAQHYAVHRPPLQLAHLAPGVRTARFIGRPGFSSRVVVAEAEFELLRQALAENFIVEDDILLETFGAGQAVPSISC